MASAAVTQLEWGYQDCEFRFQSCQHRGRMSVSTAVSPVYWNDILQILHLTVVNPDSPEMLFTPTPPSFLPAAWFPFPVVSLIRQMQEKNVWKAEHSCHFSKQNCIWMTLNGRNRSYFLTVYLLLFTALICIKWCLDFPSSPWRLPLPSIWSLPTFRPCQSNLSNLLKGQRPDCSSCIPIKLNTTELEALSSKQASVSAQRIVVIYLSTATFPSALWI